MWCGMAGTRQRSVTSQSRGKERKCSCGLAGKILFVKVTVGDLGLYRLQAQVKGSLRKDDDTAAINPPCQSYILLDSKTARLSTSPDMMWTWRMNSHQEKGTNVVDKETVQWYRAAKVYFLSHA